ncbi:MAG: methyltransferase domain-containing protein, partial [Desulfobacteraceae bacterium]|nr:methyltransferase domain-containing protein [Desulfobacteraceae bacterium]
MLESDIAIAAGGQTLYELARIGIPAIVAAIVDNQLGNIEGFQRLGFIDYAGYWDECDLLNRILGGFESLKDRKDRFQMRTKGRRIIDGKGSLRIRDALLNTKIENNTKKHKKNDSQLMKKAVSSENLIRRSATNQQYAENDFNLWTKTLLSKLSFSSVLDVCCGTGNQLVIYSAIPTVSRIVGIDISKEALSKARERLRDGVEKGRVVLKVEKMEEMFSGSDIANERFDLISCFYGLYYSQKPVGTLREMIMHLRGSGTILIVGPYGKNNADFFTLLQRHFSLPDLVIRSSTSFMEEEIYPVLLENCDVTKEQFINRIHYPSPKLLIDYWKASTFYFSEHEKNVKRDIEVYFSSHKEFIVEKHIMAYIARRRK